MGFKMSEIAGSGLEKYGFALNRRMNDNLLRESNTTANKTYHPYHMRHFMNHEKSILSFQGCVCSLIMPVNVEWIV